MQDELKKAGCPAPVAAKIAASPHYGALAPGLILALVQQFGPVVFQILEKLIDGQAPATQP